MNKPHIYKITNTVNGKYYYGVHNGNNTENYMGSGKLLKKAYDKYGKDSFSKEILLWFDTIEEAYEYEAVIVNEKQINNPMCYNLRLGGISIKMQENTKRKISESLKGRIFTEEHIEKNRQAHLGKTFSKKHKENLSKAKRGVKNPTLADRNKVINSKKVECPYGCGYINNPGNVGKHKKVCELKD